MKSSKDVQKSIYRVITGESKGVKAYLVKLLLCFLEMIYRILWKLNTFNQLKQRLPVPVVSVGNITVGGTGKTPTVLWLAQFFIRQGLKPAILTRGYKRHKQSNSIVFTSEDNRRLSPEDTGDEPYLMASLLPGIPVGVGRDRVQTGLEVLKKYPQINLFILDDGFQYRKLERQLDIVLIDAVNPFGFCHLIPRGLLREPLSGLKRADLILITRSEMREEKKIQLISAQIQKHNHEALLLRVVAENTTITNLNDIRQPAKLTVNELIGKKIGGITAIGNPEQFLASLKNTGAIVDFFDTYPDHHYWSETEIEVLIEKLGQKKINILLTTAKDGVKLKSFTNLLQLSGIVCYILNLEFKLTDEKALTLIKNVVINQKG